MFENRYVLKNIFLENIFYILYILYCFLYIYIYIYLFIYLYFYVYIFIDLLIYCIISIIGIITGTRHVFVPHPWRENVAIRHLVAWHCAYAVLPEDVREDGSDTATAGRGRRVN